MDTDALFDPGHQLAAHFGMKARQKMRDGRDPYQYVRLAASYAFQARPDLRGDDDARKQPEDFFFQMAADLTQVAFGLPRH